VGIGLELDGLMFAADVEAASASYWLSTFLMF
jgi:hypothetical protein